MTDIARADAATLPPFVEPAVFEAMGFTPEQAGMAASVASATIRNYCRWHIYPSIDETLVRDGTAATVLHLPSLYVTAVASVKMLGDELTNYEWTERGLLRRAPAWPGCWRSVEVQFTHGYNDVPADVAGVATQLGRRSLANPDGIRQETIRSYSVTYGAESSTETLPGMALGASAQLLLSAYRIPNAP